MLLYIHEHEANDVDDSKKRRSAELKHMVSSGHLKQICMAARLAGHPVDGS